MYIRTDEKHKPANSLIYSNSLLLSIDEAEALKNQIKQVNRKHNPNQKRARASQKQRKNHKAK